MLRNVNSKIIMNLIITLILAILIAVQTVISLWHVSFGFLAGYIGILTIVIGCIWGLRKKLKQIFVFASLLWIAANLVFLGNSIGTYNVKRTTYMKKVENNLDLGFSEKCNIYALNIFMSLVAFPIYPEVSLESLLLMFPCNTGYRKINNGFFLKSKRIIEVVSSGNKKDTLYARWNLNEYSLGNSEARYALALNPCSIIIKQAHADTIYEVKVRSGYPMHSEVTLIRKPIELKIEEGLFGYLQKCGWLHPYDAIWVGKKSRN